MGMEEDSSAVVVLGMNEGTGKMEMELETRWVAVVQVQAHLVAVAEVAKL